MAPQRGAVHCGAVQCRRLPPKRRLQGHRSGSSAVRQPRPQRRADLMTSATCWVVICLGRLCLRPGRLRRRLRPVQVRRVRPRAWASSTPPSSPSWLTRTRRAPCSAPCSALWRRWWAAPRAASASAGSGSEADQTPRPRRRAPLRRIPSRWATSRGSGRSLRRACTSPCTWCCVLQCWCSFACTHAHAQAHMPTHCTCRRTRRRGWAVLKSPSTSSSSLARRSSASRPPTSRRASASTPVAPTRRRAPTCFSTFSRRSCPTSRPAAWCVTTSLSCRP
mmetsp:Transcript_23508/g.75260  ORF Transcript_23508/g.75260 Transcript_23508/m.75260 type:complete len:278 (-) Transcript_23508:1002-1835(-)